MPCPDVINYKLRLNMIWNRMLHSCNHMATVGVKGLTDDGEVPVGWFHLLSLSPKRGLRLTKPGRLMWSLMIMTSPVWKSDRSEPAAFVTTITRTPIAWNTRTGNVTYIDNIALQTYRDESPTCFNNHTQNVHSRPLSTGKIDRPCLAIHSFSS